MKKIIALSAAIAIALAGCEKKTGDFKISAENLPTELNDQMVYFALAGTPEPFDSVDIVDGSFEKTLTNLNSDQIVYTLIGIDYFILIPEPGSVHIVKTDLEGMPYEVVTEKPEGLNARLQEFTKEMHDAISPIQSEYAAAAKKNNELYLSGTASETELAEIDRRLNEIGERLSNARNAVARKHYEANKDNPIGEIAFGEIPFDSDADFIAAYESANDNIKNNKRYAKKYEKLKHASETQVGMQYKDYTIEDGLGNSAKLSDYLSDSRYLVVDFWASWCGPCRKAMPHLAKISQEKSRTVRVLSIGVWDENIEDYEQAKQELNMTWDTLYDKEGEGTKLYGIEGIPTILLISPKGEILVRTHVPADIDAKLAELNL